ncbi:MAG TPA: helix-turn-helix domain-containing protein [Acidimicrobiales bacterium]|nr:helix-turn-helix domain-containing protein [Acidimicrobiales bacterium]
MALRLLGDEHPSFEDLPLVLTVEEAAAVLRIGRSAAYDQARIFRATNGAEGLLVICGGRNLRVPRAALERLLDPGSSIKRPAS